MTQTNAALWSFHLKKHSMAHGLKTIWFASSKSMLQDFVRTSVTWNLTVSALILIKGQMEMEIINVNWIILLVKDTRRIWGRTKIFFIIQLRYVLTANLSIKKRKKKHQINHSNLFEFLIKKGGAERRNCYLYWLCLNLKRDTMLKIQIGGIRLKHLWA